MENVADESVSRSMFASAVVVEAVLEFELELAFEDVAFAEETFHCLSDLADQDSDLV